MLLHFFLNRFKGTPAGLQSSQTIREEVEGTSDSGWRWEAQRWAAQRPGRVHLCFLWREALDRCQGRSAIDSEFFCFAFNQANAVCRQTNWTAECVSWNVSLRSQRRRWPEPTPTVGSCRGSWTTLPRRQTPWTEKSALWRASWGTDLNLHISNKTSQLLQ